MVIIGYAGDPQSKFGTLYMATVISLCSIIIFKCMDILQEGFSLFPFITFLVFIFVFYKSVIYIREYINLVLSMRKKHQEVEPT